MNYGPERRPVGCHLPATYAATIAGRYHCRKSETVSEGAVPPALWVRHTSHGMNMSMNMNIDMKQRDHALRMQTPQSPPPQNPCLASRWAP